MINVDEAFILSGWIFSTQNRKTWYLAAMIILPWVIYRSGQWDLCPQHLRRDKIRSRFSSMLLSHQRISSLPAYPDMETHKNDWCRIKTSFPLSIFVICILRTSFERGHFSESLRESETLETWDIVARPTQKAAEYQSNLSTATGSVSVVLSTAKGRPSPPLPPVSDNYLPRFDKIRVLRAILNRLARIHLTQGQFTLMG